MKTLETTLLQLLDEFRRLGIADQIHYDKFYLYSLITHSTAIEGSTVTEIENQLLFDEGISAKGRNIVEQLMNLDLKLAYEKSFSHAKNHELISVEMLKELSALVMKNTGSEFHTLSGTFDSSKGDLRLVNVTAGLGGHSYMNFIKVPEKLQLFCEQINVRRQQLLDSDNILEKYLLSFDAHYFLVTIHPWVDGNGRMSRLIMNQLQFDMGLIPSKVIKEDKVGYVQALIDSREQESMEPFRRFMLAEHCKNLEAEIEQFNKSREYDPFVGLSETKEAYQKKGGVSSTFEVNDLVSFPFYIYPKHSTDRDPISQTVVEKCIQIATKALYGKRDRDGNALILHSLIVGSMGLTDAEKCVGFLHDVVEDTDWTFEDLISEGIPDEVVEALRLCTHEKGVPYYEYVQRIIDSGNQTALHVKWNDLKHNLARGKAFSYPELVAKHRKALQMVEEALFK